MHIYKEFKKPIYSLAPMEDITDTVFRQIVGSVGKPDLLYTEFVNVEGLDSKGREKVIHRLKYDVFEKPIIAQLWGINPEKFFRASQLVKELGFDGVDINMGCSVKKVTNHSTGSGLINEDRGKVKAIIDAVKDGSGGLPVSVKTRLGWDRSDMDWIKFLLNQNLDVLTIHGRTARGSESVNANWDMISKCVQLRDELHSNTLIFGNGDIQSFNQAREHVKTYGVDGVMVGRAVLFNPFFFSSKKSISQRDRYVLLRKHLLLYDKTWGSSKTYPEFRKYIRGYVNNFEGSNDIRKLFMECNTVLEAITLIDTLL